MEYDDEYISGSRKLYRHFGGKRNDHLLLYRDDGADNDHQSGYGRDDDGTGNKSGKIVYKADRFCRGAMTRQIERTLCRGKS